MSYPLIFDLATTQALLERLDKIQPDTKPLWGKMNAGQMLAHVNVAYDINYGVIPQRYNMFSRFMVRLFAKATVVGDKPYVKNGRTAPVFIVEGQRDFAAEKTKLVNYMKRLQAEGAASYEGKENAGFGKLTAQEWSNLFWKHADHHFRQFGV